MFNVVVRNGSWCRVLASAVLPTDTFPRQGFQPIVKHFTSRHNEVAQCVQITERNKEIPRIISDRGRIDEADGLWFVRSRRLHDTSRQGTTRPLQTETREGLGDTRPNASRVSFLLYPMEQADTGSINT